MDEFKDNGIINGIDSKNGTRHSMDKNIENIDIIDIDIDINIDDVSNSDIEEVDKYNDFDYEILTKNKSEERKGQRRYKEKLIKRYGEKCMLTSKSYALQACHIKPYSLCKKESKKEIYDVNNGLVLKADIHILFDIGQISINPSTLKWEISEELLNEEDLKQFDGKEMSVLKGKNSVIKYLEYHYNTIYKKIKK